jgi:hypothetical protein
MLFVDYVFDLMPDGSILMDKELSAKSLQVKTGDRFDVHISFDGRIILRKVPNVNTEPKTDNRESEAV